ncbi:hypothetical protein KSP40_PGU011041 [Platanthera guangdongensis]|uniref:Uncharacterized protein n=1 Tax=Platanthera guangdongensis TaxID=2320717 RepID=A0ABR2M914_9ASPA
MNSVSSTFRFKLRVFPANFRPLCTIPTDFSDSPQVFHGRKSVLLKAVSRVRVRARFTDAELKESWLDSLSYPFCEKGKSPTEKIDQIEKVSTAEWIIGIDPDVCGALALLKEDASGCKAQVFDTPYLQVLVGKRTRKRLDAKSIVQLLRGLGAPPEGKIGLGGGCWADGGRGGCEESLGRLSMDWMGTKGRGILKLGCLGAGREENRAWWWLSGMCDYGNDIYGCWAAWRSLKDEEDGQRWLQRVKWLLDRIP